MTGHACMACQHGTKSQKLSCPLLSSCFSWFCPRLGLGQSPHPAMPSQSRFQRPASETCNVELVSREWKDAAGVRLVVIEHDRMFISSKGPGHAVKFSIKDCVFNKNVLIPILHRMARHPKHPVPYIKPLQAENLS